MSPGRVFEPCEAHWLESRWVGLTLSDRTNETLSELDIIMSLGPGFIERIERPESDALSELRDEAAHDVRESLQGSGFDTTPEIVRKSTYTYYYDWERDDPEYVFLVQNPGTLSRRHEMKGIRASRSPIEYVRTYRTYAQEWLLEKNEHFSSRFFPLLTRYGLLEGAEEWRTYLKEGFYDDFYLTDLIKYRVKTGDIGDRHRRAGFEEHLHEELRLVDPELVFAFSARVWDTLREELDLRPVSDGAVPDATVSNAHGHLYRATGALDTHVLPLSHFSMRVYALLLRDSYFEYLHDALSAYPNETG